MKFGVRDVRKIIVSERIVSERTEGVPGDEFVPKESSMKIYGVGALFVCLLALMISGTAWASVYVVAMTGSDGDPGTALRHHPKGGGCGAGG